MLMSYKCYLAFDCKTTLFYNLVIEKEREMSNKN